MINFCQAYEKIRYPLFYAPPFAKPSRNRRRQILRPLQMDTLLVAFIKHYANTPNKKKHAKSTKIPHKIW